MLSTLLAAAALVGPTAQSLVQERDLELALRVSSNRFVAFNPTEQPELLVFEDVEHARRATVIVPAHGSIDLRFSVLTIEGLQMTVYARTTTGVVATKPWSLSELRQIGSPLVLDVQNGHAHAWIPTERGARLVGEESERGAGCGGHALCSPPASHVPVVTPYDGPRGDLPPKLERTLPPL